MGCEWCGGAEHTQHNSEPPLVGPRFVGGGCRRRRVCGGVTPPHDTAHDEHDRLPAAGKNPPMMMGHHDNVSSAMNVVPSSGRLSARCCSTLRASTIAADDSTFPSVLASSSCSIHHLTTHFSFDVTPTRGCDLPDLASRRPHCAHRAGRRRPAPRPLSLRRFRRCRRASARW